MKRVQKRIVWIISISIILILGILISPFIVFRLSIGETKRIEREVRYQLVDIGQNGDPRYWFEANRGNKRLFLASEDPMPVWIYVSPDDFEKCWSVAWQVMQRDTFTFVAVIESKPLLFVNDYSLAKVLEIKRIRKFPMVRK